MSEAQYRFDLLYKHSSSVALSSREKLGSEFSRVRTCFDFLDQHFHKLRIKPRSHSRNVRMALTTRFTNHLFSHVLLVERGLLLDAMSCARSATETTAFYWLVCRDESTASLYDAEKSPRPVDIRKRLEKLAINVDDLQEKYGFESQVSHVGNKYDNLQIAWETDGSGALLIGGAENTLVQKGIMQAVAGTVARFVMCDDDYVVTIADDHATVAERIRTS